MNPDSNPYEGFGLLKGVDPVPWGRVRVNPVLPGYVTWFGLVAGLVGLGVFGPMLWLTTDFWPIPVILTLCALFWVDFVATTTVIVRRKRRKKRAEHRADA